MVIKIVLNKELLQAADQAAQRTRTNRSALVRDALRAHLRSLEIREKEECDRRGYARMPQTRDEALAWEDADGKVWLSYNSPDHLQQRHSFPAELEKNLTAVEPLLAQAVAD